MPRYSPRPYTFRVCLEDESGCEIRSSIEVPLYDPQADSEHLDLAEITDAANILACRDRGVGIELADPVRRFWYEPDRWRRAFDGLGFSGMYEGLPALAVVKRINLHFQGVPLKRGQRGPGLGNYDVRQFLIAEVLRRMADVKHIKDVAEAVTREHHDILPWPFENAAGTLGKAVWRELNGGS